MKQKRTYRSILFVLYFGALALIKLGRDGYHPGNAILYWDYIERNVQFIPAKTILEMLGLIFNGDTYGTVRVFAALNLLGNMILFIPIGFFLSRKRFLKLVVGSLLLTVFIETVQLFTLKGSFDIDDILLNVMGAIIGYFFCNKLLARKETR